MDEGDRFLLFLDSKKLSVSTMKEYMIRYRCFPKDVRLNEQVVRNFVSRYNNSIGRAFTKAYLEFKGIKDIELPKITGRKRVRIAKVLKKDEFHRLREALYQRQIKYGLMFDLQYYCALRRAELCSIIPDWFELDEWFKDQNKGCVLHIFGKNDKERLVVVPNWLMDDLLEYMQEKNLNFEDKLFDIEPYTWWEKLREISKVSIGRYVRTHELRHTRATNWLREGKPIDRVQRMVGHASIATTQNYAHLSDEEIVDEWQKDNN